MISRPWGVKLGVVEGCNRMCKFCGIWAIRDGPGNYKFMAMETAEKMADQLADLCPTGRVEIAQHGEPLMHPQLGDIVRVLRQRMPKFQIMVVTNGLVLLGDMQAKLEALFDAGVNHFMVDCYMPEAPRLYKAAQQLHDIDVFDYYADLMPNKISPYVHQHGKKLNRSIILTGDISKAPGSHVTRQLHNQAGNVVFGDLKPLEKPLRKMCVRPFRELSISHTGEVTICCNDYGREYVCGNLNVQSLTEIWQGDELEAARRVLYSRSRDFSPCCRCDDRGGFRVGLVDAKELPNEEDYDIIEACVLSSPRINKHIPIVRGVVR